MATPQLDEEKIRKQAKLIMDEFVKALDKVGELAGDAGLERDEMTRMGKKAEPDSAFRSRMLKNAPRKDKDHVMAERKSW